MIEQRLAGRAFEIATSAVETAGRASDPWEWVVFVLVVVVVLGAIVLSCWD